MSILVIGFPGALSKGVARRIAEDRKESVRLLVPPKHMRGATAFAGQTKGDVFCQEGSCGQIDFGLSGPDYLALADEVTAVMDLTLHAPPGRAQASGDSPAPGGLRELIEFALAAKGRAHVIALSHVDVAGNTEREFTEADLELGQGWKDMAEEERLRRERVLRRFMGKLPITVARSGWVIGQGQGCCPLAALLLSVKDRTALPAKAQEGVVHAIEVEALSEILAAEALSGPGPGGRTLHLVFRNPPPLWVLADRARRIAAERAPDGFDVAAGARSALRKDRSSERWWSARHFFKRQPYGATLSTAGTESLLSKMGITLPEYDPAIMDRLVEREIEKMIRLRSR